MSASNKTPSSERKTNPAIPSAVAKAKAANTNSNQDTVTASATTATYDVSQGIDTSGPAFSKCPGCGKMTANRLLGEVEQQLYLIWLGRVSTGMCASNENLIPADHKIALAVLLSGIPCDRMYCEKCTLLAEIAA